MIDDYFYECGYCSVVFGSGGRTRTPISDSPRLEDDRVTVNGTTCRWRVTGQCPACGEENPVVRIVQRS